jgi:hypothetical protein
MSLPEGKCSGNLLKVRGPWAEPQTLENRSTPARGPPLGSFVSDFKGGTRQ